MSPLESCGLACAGRIRVPRRPTAPAFRRGADVDHAARHFEEVPLHVRVDNALERWGGNRLLDTATSLLSFITVCTYIASTYGVLDTTAFDLVVGCCFAAEWLFRAWKSRSTMAFVCSWWSLVDVVTFLPMIVLTATNNMWAQAPPLRLLPTQPSQACCLSEHTTQQAHLSCAPPPWCIWDRSAAPAPPLPAGASTRRR